MGRNALSRTRRETGVVAPLLVWRELDAIETMRSEHLHIRQAAARLRRHSRRRIILEARLIELTRQILIAEAALTPPAKTAPSKKELH